MSGKPQPGSKRRRRTSSGGRHRAARLAAVQALYQIEIGGAGFGDVVQEFLDHRLAGDGDGDGDGPARTDKRMFAELVNGVSVGLVELDALIAPTLDKGRVLERLETVLRCILRLAAFELVRRAQVPARVTISEYVGLTGAFFSGNEPSMANGVLDRLAREVRPGEFDAAREGVTGGAGEQKAG